MVDEQTIFDQVKGMLHLGLPLPGNTDAVSASTGDLGGNAQNTGGAGNTSWTDYAASAASSVKDFVTAPYRVVKGAYAEVKDAAQTAQEMVARAESSASSAATGFVSWTKWIVVGICAVAVIYFLGLASSVIPRKP